MCWRCIHVAVASYANKSVRGSSVAGGAAREERKDLRSPSLLPHPRNCSEDSTIFIEAGY